MRLVPKQHKNKMLRKLASPPISYGVIDCGFRFFVQPETRSKTDLRAWEIYFDGKTAESVKSYCWLVWPKSQTRRSAKEAFADRVKSDPPPVAAIEVFEMLPPPAIAG